MSHPFLQRDSPQRDAVERLQRALVAAGFQVDVDGLFGPGTERAVKRFQEREGLDVDGKVGKRTWAALERFTETHESDAHESDLADTLPGFRGDVGWIHRWEGHAGKPYWPKGASGVTLDPGLDLGHAKPELIRAVYGERLSAAQLAAVEKVFGLRGEAARDALAADPTLQSIRVDRATATAIFPHVARPYWASSVKRFAGLDSDAAPAAVHTAMLSLTYNRGAGNRYLEVLKPPIAERDWAQLGQRISRMQQDHRLEGIRRRRRAEGELILAALKGA